MGKDNRGKLFKDNNHVNGLLDKGCNFEGKLTFDGVVQVNGDFRGEIYSDGTLVVGQNANIDAKVFIDTIIIDGNVQGSLEAKSKVELHRGGTLVANVQTRSFMIEDGGLFKGKCEMPVTDARSDVMCSTVEDDKVYVRSKGKDDQMVM